MITTAALSIFSGLCMVGFYSWNVSIVNCENVIDINEREKNKTINWETDSDLCNINETILTIIDADGNFVNWFYYRSMATCL